MKLRLTIVLLLLLVAASPSFAGSVCTRRDSIAAENSIDYLKSWRALYTSYRRYRQCDDGAIAEGYSDAVAQLMTKQWAKIGDVAALAKTDPDFGDWLIRHLDETDDDRDLVTIERLARTACPLPLQWFCRKVHDQIRSLGCEKSYPQGSGCIAAKYPL